MGEMKGAVIVSFLFTAFIFPFILVLLILNINQSAFYATTQSMNALIEQKGAVDSEVRKMFENMEKDDREGSGAKYTITVDKEAKSPDSESGQLYPSGSGGERNYYGDVLVVTYEYEYKVLFLDKHKLQTTKRIPVTKRFGENI